MAFIVCKIKRSVGFTYFGLTPFVAANTNFVATSVWNSGGRWRYSVKPVRSSGTSGCG